MATQKPKVLIVDDEPLLREILEERFQVFGYDTQASESGNKAWAYLQKNQVDLVVSDIKMPDGTGIELLKKIKQHNPFSPTVFLITGFHQDFVEAELFNQGADGFFPKPFDANLIRKVAQKGLIPKKTLWSLKERHTATRKLSKDFSSFAEAEKNHDIAIGRRGFSIVDSDGGFAQSEVVDFSYTFKDAPALRGVGRIVWQIAKDGRRGLGIEILYLEPDSLSHYLKLIEERKPVASTPCIFCR